MWRQDQTLGSYVPIPDLDLSVDDGVAIQSAKGVPQQTIPDMGVLYGWLESNYPLLLKGGSKRRLNGYDKRLICRTLPYLTHVEKDLKRIHGISGADVQEPTLGDQEQRMFTYYIVSRHGKRRVTTHCEN